MSENITHWYVAGGPDTNPGLDYSAVPHVINVAAERPSLMPSLKGITNVLDAEGVDPQHYKSAAFITADKAYFDWMERSFNNPIFKFLYGAHTSRLTYVQKRGEIETAMHPIIFIDISSERSIRRNNKRLLHELGHLAREAQNIDLAVAYNDPARIGEIKHRAMASCTESVTTMMTALPIEAGFHTQYPFLTGMSMMAAIVSAGGIISPEYYAWLSEKEERMANRFARKHKRESVLREVD